MLSCGGGVLLVDVLARGVASRWLLWFSFRHIAVVSVIVFECWLYAVAVCFVLL